MKKRRQLSGKPLPALNLGHLESLLTPQGLWQHTRYEQPAVDHGFSIDDQARGLIVGAWLKVLSCQSPAWLGESAPAASLADRLIETCLTYIEQAQTADGRFHNFRSDTNDWLDEVGSDDSFARTLWSMYTCQRLLPEAAVTARIQTVLERAEPHISQINSPRACGFLMLESENKSHLRLLGRKMVEWYRLVRQPEWRWFENYLTYENPRLPHGLLLAAIRTENPEWMPVARESMNFLLENTFTDSGYFNAIGSDGWYVKGKKRAQFDQQPVDAGATVEMCLDSWRIFDYDLYLDYARKGLDWYHGDNLLQIPLYEPNSGIVYDGLTPMGVNLNRGAESVLSYMLARIKWEVYTSR